MSDALAYSKSPLMNMVKEYRSSDAFETDIHAMRKLGWLLHSWQMVSQSSNTISPYSYIIIAVYKGGSSSE